jgi:hypothetical protein
VRLWRCSIRAAAASGAIERRSQGVAWKRGDSPGSSPATGSSRSFSTMISIRRSTTSRSRTWIARYTCPTLRGPAATAWAIVEHQPPSIASIREVALS